MLRGTPIIAPEYVMAVLPVRTSLAVLTPALFNLLNFLVRARYFVSLFYVTTIFRLLPAPNPTPSAFTRSR